MNPDGSGSNVVAQGSFWTGAWAPDHHAVVAVDYGQNTLHIFDLADGSDRVLLQRSGTDWDRPQYNLHWSPDLSTITYGCNENICAVDTATGATRDLVTDLGLRDGNTSSDGSPPYFVFGSWAPGGRQFSYLAQTGSSNGEPRFTPMIADLTTGQHWPLADQIVGPYAHLPFTADAQSVVVVRSDGCFKVCSYQTELVPIHGGTPRDVPGVSSDAIDRSPDGNWFLEPSDMVSNPQTAVMFNLDGQTRQVSTGSDFPVGW